MFQFAGFATYAYGFSVRQFEDLRINARLTASRSLSQSSTLFIAFWRQDIPHTPLVAWPHLSCPLLSPPSAFRLAAKTHAVSRMLTMGIASVPATCPAPASWAVTILCVIS
jgi:hypothetical protein